MSSARNTSKISVIIRHEFMSRIKTKSFLLSTMLMPIGLLMLIAVPVLVSVLSEDSGKRQLEIVDKSGVVGHKLVEYDSALFTTAEKPEAELQELTKEKKISGYIVIPKNVFLSDTVQVFTKGGGGVLFSTRVEKAVQNVLQVERMRNAGADSSMLMLMDKKTECVTVKLGDKGAEKDASELMAIVGYMMGFMIYMMMFIYGSIVMRAVLEEKTNRIVEVLASSAKPFEIMMGKILGVGAVGIVQVVLWVGMSMAVTTFAGPVIQSMLGAGDSQQAVEMLKAKDMSAASVAFNLPSISPWLIIGFVFYFISGYFMYSSLFAGIAAAADQEQDLQSLQTPITLPLIIPMLFIGNIITAPDGTIATILSMIPLFTPTLMIVRAAATQVPLWQIVVSSLMVVLTFFAAVWAAGRIYRVGILSYGKKASFKDIAKWLVRG
ncbi:MAG: ABC transporter permease [Candidatus Kapabacteria bacterium]|nr:ABC transporter permease [Candidatus Kapabacteria bacterium]